MKKILLTYIIATSFVCSQGDIYPTEANYGGGIGFSAMYMVLDSVPGESLLNNLGFKMDKFGTRPLVFYGGEGFAQMSGPWRLGGYAGIGKAQVSDVYSIYLYKDNDNDREFDPGEEIEKHKTNNLNVKAHLNFLLGAATIEYVVPIYRDLEVMGGALMGLGSYTLRMDQQLEFPMWENIGESIYGTIKGDSVLVEVDPPGDIKDGALKDNRVYPLDIKTSMTEISGLFFNFQPYVAIKWQFLDRMGLRITAGYNKGTIKDGTWRLNGGSEIKDSPAAALRGITLRTVIYFGL